MGLYIRDKPGVIYDRGSDRYKPVNLYHGSKKAAGWREDTQSGALVSLTDTYTDRLLSCRIGGATAQSGIGDPSSDNVRPFVEVKPPAVTATGRNLLKMLPPGTYKDGGTEIVAVVMPDGSMSVTGAPTTWRSIALPIGYALAPGTYSTNYRQTAKGMLKVYLDNEMVIQGDNNTKITFTIAKPKTVTSVYYQFGTNFTGHEIIYPQLILGGTPPADADYTPYTGASVPTGLTEPLWEGDWRDVVTGDEWREMYYGRLADIVAVGGPDIEGDDYVRFICNNTSGVQPIGDSFSLAIARCNVLTPKNHNGVSAVNSNSIAVWYLPGYGTYGRIDISIAKALIGWDAAWTTTQKRSALINWLNATNAMVLYPRATPLHTYGTPVTIPTYPGHTNVQAEGAQLTATARVIDRTL